MNGNRLSIADCNLRRVVIEQSVPIPDRSNFEIGPTLRAIDSRRRFSPAPRTASIEYFQVENVVFDGQTGAVFKNGIHVSETRYSTQPSHTFNVDPSRVLPLTETRPILIGFHAWHHNYYHWLTQCVPSMFWAFRVSGPAEMTYALPPLAPWQDRVLELAGLSVTQRYTVDLRRQYAVDQLVYTTFTQGAATYRPSQKACEVFRRIHSHTKRAASPANDVIYVSRLDTATRKMRNEPEIIKLLETEGVEVVVPGCHPLEEQVAKFSSAKAVIGPHGAGLTNIVFCEPGATLYEIMGDRKPNPCYANLAQSMGMNYWAEAFTSHHSEHEEWAADPYQVLAAAQRLLAMPPIRPG